VNKHKAPDIEVHGGSEIPADLLTPEPLGENYGLDGYPDMEYGSGVLEGILPEDAPPQAALPDGIVTAEDFGLDLTFLTKDANLADLSWLELQEQDPERLPKNTKTDVAVPELEEAWGVDRRTDGVHYADHRVDLEHARYQASLESDEAPSLKFSARDLARVARKAMRRSARGQDLTGILREAAETLGAEAPRIRSLMQSVASEHGLAGNVFIRASAYPGYEQGKWGKELKRFGKALYILVDKVALEGSTHIQDGHCMVTGKTAVLAVPWKAAYQHYRPLLEATGRKVAGSDPREALKAAFFATPERLARPAHHLPTHKAPADRVSRQAAWQKFHSAPAPVRAHYDVAERRVAQRRAAAWRKIEAWSKAGLVPLDVAMSIVSPALTGEQMLGRVAALIVKSKGASAFSGIPIDTRPPEISRDAADKALAGVETPEPINVSHRPLEAKKAQALVTLARWVKAGLLAESDARRLAKSNAEPFDILKAASALVTAVPKTADYSGMSNDNQPAATASREDVFTALRLAEKKSKSVQTLVDATVKQRKTASSHLAKKIATLQAKVDKIKAAIDRGITGKPLQAMIVRVIPPKDVKLAARMLGPVLRKTGALEEKRAGRQEYAGPAYRAVPQKVAEVSPHAREVEAMLKWTRQAMCEGFAGNDLRDLIQTRFSATVRKEGASQLSALRKTHEGGSGFIYIEAAAYATKGGTKGCEEGALKHRANQVKHVLAMKKCRSCALANKLSDGSRVCQEYNKTLVSASDFPSEVPSMRKANIKAANAGDAELTASLFAPTFNPDEFGLHNGSLEDIAFEAGPQANDLGEILFGGLELGEWTD
jgi:hypothetical protein